MSSALTLDPEASIVFRKALRKQRNLAVQENLVCQETNGIVNT